MRSLYTFLWYLILPAVLLRLLWRSLRAPLYRRDIGQRFGFYPQAIKNCLWVHAVSVGESIAAIPLIKRLREQYPNLPLLVTTMTPTGKQRILAAFGTSVQHFYLPYDIPFAVQRFLRTCQPKIAIIMETELWPNLLHYCHQKKIPICLLNARLSEQSAKGYQRIASFTQQMLTHLSVLAASSEDDAARFIALGMDEKKVQVTGNIKFDLTPPKALAEQQLVLRRQLGVSRFVWIAASTHAGEEEIILAAHAKVRKKMEDALLLLVPRHPDRFASVHKLCAKNFKTQTRSEGAKVSNDTAIYFCDSMGELLLFYAVSEVAFVGGSLVPIGGHNILEPGILAKPIITGPYLHNFAEISELFGKADAFIKVWDAPELAEKIVLFGQSEQARQEYGARALQLVQQNQGALKKQYELVDVLLKQGMLENG